MQVSIGTIIQLIFVLQCSGAIQISKEQNIFEVKDMNGYTQIVSISGFSDGSETLPIFYNLLERVSEIEFLTSTDNQKWKKHKSKDLVMEDASYSTFYNGLKVIHINLAKNEYFRISYSVKVSEIKLLSSLALKNPVKTDTIINIINLSKALFFSWSSLPYDSTYAFSLDSIKTNSTISYVFTSIATKKGDPGKTCSKRFYCIVHPPENTPAIELNNWLIALQRPVDGISQKTIDEINLLTAGITDTLEITKRLFEYVKKTVSYIDIEAGYGAWQSRKADDILVARKGDCKDMANLVYQMLKYKKVICYIGILPTLSHDDDYLFPSLSGFNHEICVVCINKIWYFLDATDNNNFFDYPSRHSQGRSVFCISDSLPFILKIPAVSPEQNRVSHTLVFNVSDTGITGSWDIDFNGYCAVNLLDYINNLSVGKVHEFFIQYFKAIAPKITILSSTYAISESGVVTVHGLFKTASTMISEDGKKHYLSLKYMPAAVIDDMQENNCRHYMHSAIFNNFNISFRFSRPVILNKEFNEKDGEHKMQYELAFKQTKEKEIDLTYSYINPNLEYNKELYNSYENLVNKINKSFNTLIIYE